MDLGVTEAGVLDEGLRLIRLADAARVPLRLLGGIAVAARVPSWRVRADRPGRDIDVATDRASRRAVTELLEGQGYVADRRYNAANGHKQLYFVDPERGRPVDVLIDQMEMCHTFDFAADLACPGPTLPLADLLLSKLQVVRINRKDYLDVLILLAEFPLSDGSGGEARGGAAAGANRDGSGAEAAAAEAPGADRIEVGQITKYTSADWGWWRTVGGNLDGCRAFVEDGLAPDDLDVGRPNRFDPGAQAVELRRRIDSAPKSLGWRVRARLGERVPWYQEPEEEAHD